MSYESLFAVNGVVITENLRGQPFTCTSRMRCRRRPIATSGVSAEFGRFGGGLVNAITKSGSDTFSGSYRQSFNNDDWRATSPFNEAKLDRVVPTYEYTFGGPIARRQLWFFNAGRFQEQQSSFNTAVTSIPYIRTNDEKRYEIKGTYSPMAGHTGRVAYSKIDQQVNNFSAGNIMDTRSLFNQGQPQDLLSVHYTGVLYPQSLCRGSMGAAHVHLRRRGRADPGSDRGHAAHRSRARRHQLPLLVADVLRRLRQRRGAQQHRFDRQGVVFPVDARERLASSGLRLWTATTITGLTNNHQSGSDYRILGTSTIVRGTDIVPVFLPNSTIIQWNPITHAQPGHGPAHQFGVLQRSVAVQRQLHVQSGRALGSQSRRGCGRRHGVRQQQVESPSRRGLRPDRRRRLVGDGQLRPLCERAQHGAGRYVARRQFIAVPVAVSRTGREPRFQRRR